MKASINEITAGSLSVGQVDVSEVSVGPMHAGTLVLDSTHVDVATGAAAFTDLRVTVTLTMRIDWRVTIKIPLAGSYSWNGTLKVGTHSFTIGLGDVTVPGLESFEMDVSTASFDDVEATVAPLRDLHLGPLVAEELRLHGAIAPVPSFTLTGLGLGRIGVAGLSVPGATSADATVARVTGRTVPVGSVTVADLRLPEATAAQVTSEAVDVSGTSRPVRFVADAGLLALTLHTTPAARIQTEELRLSNVRTSASIGALELRDVVLPFELLGLTLSDLGIELIDIPTVEVT